MTKTATLNLEPFANNFSENHEFIRDVHDLPSTNANGRHELEDNTAYYFADIVFSNHPLELGSNSPLIGMFGSISGFVNQAGGTAIYGNGAPYFQRDMLIDAPGGQMFDLTATNSEEMLVLDSSFADPINLGNVGNLGTIDGFRVPTFKGCNFEDFDAGLTFDGNPDKIFVSECPLRSVSASNVTIFTLSGTSSAQIVDFVGNYIKFVQSDTEVWRVESGGEPSEVFQYRGNTHDTSVTKSNILTGANAGLDVEPFWVTQSYPLQASGVTGEMHDDNNVTPASVTISTTDTWTDVDIASVLGTDNRVVKESEGHMEYVGSKDFVANVATNVSFYGANGDIYRWGVGLNGNDPEPQHTSIVEARGKNANISVPVNAVFGNLTTNDVLHMKVKNESATNDLTISGYTFTVSGN